MGKDPVEAERLFTRGILIILGAVIVALCVIALIFIPAA